MKGKLRWKISGQDNSHQHAKNPKWDTRRSNTSLEVIIFYSPNVLSPGHYFTRIGDAMHKKNLGHSCYCEQLQVP